MHFAQRDNWKNKKPEWICGFLCFLALSYLAFVLVQKKLYLKSANAVLEAYTTQVSAQVDGEIRDVLVDENESVHKGQLLCVLDGRKYRNLLTQAESKLSSMEAEEANARRDATRLHWLKIKNSVSVMDADHADAKLRNLNEQVDKLRTDVAIAKNNLQKTNVVAKEDGTISFRVAQPGYYATTGRPLFGFVSNRSRWVTAKIKETDLASLKVGAPVRVYFDAYQNKKIVGHVESLSPATETPFGTAIADPAAGNFTKYVQWHPIRIALELSDDERARIPVGSSVEISLRRQK